MALNLDEIARRAGVSRATVSRVINNHPYVSQGVRSRVQAVIDESGFQPHAAARALARRRTEVLGIIAPEGMGSIFSMPYFPVLLDGISSVIGQSQYVMSMWVGSTPQETRRIYERILGTRMMDGALLLSSIEGDSLPQQLADRKMPIVLIGSSALPEIATVDVDNVIAGRSATEHLLRLGRRRIGHLTGRLDLHSGHERLQGYREAMEASPFGFDPALVVGADFSEEAGYHAAREFASRRVDAIFSASDTMAFGLLRAFQEMGVTVPGQIALMGFDDLPQAANSRPALTTVRQPIRQLGMAAAQLLIDLVDEKVSLPHRIVFPTEVIVRESCGLLRDGR